MTITSLDLPILQALGIDAAAHPAIETVAEVVAAWGIAIVPLGLLALWLSGQHEARHAGVLAAMTAGLALLFAGMLSFAFYEPRPFAEGLSPNVLHHVADSSFPSDHVTVLAAVAFTMVATRRHGAALALSLATALVAWARVALGVHYPSDVVGGAMLGLAAVLLFRTTLLDHLSRFTTRIAEGLAGGLRCDRWVGRLREANVRR